MKKIFLLLFFTLNIAAQSDFNNLVWKFRGPDNYALEAKEVIDLSSDPNASTKVWACTLFDGLIYNDNISDENSEWKKSTLPIKRVYKIRFDPNKPQVAHAIGDFSNWKTIDGGKTWTELSFFNTNTRFYDIWVSKKGNVVAATKDGVYYSNDEGKNWIAYISVGYPRTIKQLWVQENERIYVLKDDNSGQYADPPYKDWNDISLKQMRIEEMPLPEFEEFHAFVVQTGEVLHGFNAERRKILRDGFYSIDGGSTFKPYPKPPAMTETVFVGNDLVFATKNGVFVLKNDTKIGTEQRNKGLLKGEFSMFTDRNIVGDNYYAGLSTKGMFLINSLDSGPAFEVSDKGEHYNYLTNFNATKATSNSYNVVAIEESKINTLAISNYLEAKKVLPITQNINLFLSKNGGIAKWTTNSLSNLSDSKIDFLLLSAFPVVDIYYNAVMNVVYGLDRLGNLVRVKNPTAASLASMIFTYKQLPLRNFEEGQIEEISSDGKIILITDKTTNIWFTIDEGTSWQKLNTDGIKDLKINHLEYATKYQKLFLATEAGIFMGENILTNTPKWTNISKEIGTQPCTFIQLRSSDDQLAVMTRFKGIYSTTIFSEANQIITFSPTYANFNSQDYPYFLSENLLPTICNNSKIKINFTSNIPENPNVDYVVAVSDDAGNFAATPFILKGSSKKSPVEVEFVKPQDPRRNFFKFKVIARGAVQATGSETPEVYVSDTKEFSISSGQFTLGCSVDLKTNETFTTPPYSWKKDENYLGKNLILINGANNSTLNVSQPGLYERSTEFNGCVLKSTFGVYYSPVHTSIPIKPNIGFSYAGNTCVVDSFKLFTDFNNTYKYQWLRNDVEIKNINKSEIFIKDKSIYKLIVSYPTGCKYTSEPIQLKTCETTTGNQAIILNPPKISSDKTNIYANQKAVLSIEGCSNVNLQWLKDTKPIVGAIQKTLEVKETGNYALQIEKLGCIATANAIKITVENVLAVGEEQPQINIEVYPNPSSEKLFVFIPTQINEPIFAKMTDISGKLIENYDFSENQNPTIDIKNLHEGVYLLVFETKEKRVVKKIIKKD